MNQGYSLRYHGKLSISEDSKSILVSGDTFAYAFDKGNGLISKLEIAGQDFLQGMEPGIPAISILGNPEDTLFAARYEDEAECDIISESPYEVRIRTHGVYHDSSHNTLPIRYRITYEIHNDGTIFIMVDNKAYESCSIRWLCVSKGVLNPSFCRYYAHLADFAENDSLDCYTFRKMEEKEILFSGTLIPWFWFGNDISGIEISIRDNISESMKAGMSKTTGVMWEVISIPVSDEALNVSPGWEQTNYFSISITPSKRYLPEFSSLIAYREDRYENVTDDEIYEFSRKGCNLMIVSINRSGEFVPNDEPEIRRVISKCHEYGMKIVPYISLMELSREREHKEEWLVKPESDTENQVMCPASEGWREFWKQSIKDLIDKYDFDGLYIDIHYDRLACQNPLHGCNRRYMRPSLIWVRDMLRYAWIRV